MNTNSPRQPPKSNRQILDEASAWFVEFRVGDTDLGSRAEFDRWVRQSPEHVRAYMEIARAYHELGAMDSEQVDKLSEVISAAGQRDRVVKLEPAKTTRQSRRKFGRWIPASFAAAVAAGLLVWLGLPKYSTYSTGVGENRTVRMPDGSTITLNAVTEIKVRYTATARVIDLVSGQAFFQVVANRSRPFIVRSGYALVRDVGTQFDVDRTAGSTTVTVVEGQVALYPMSEARSAFAAESAVDSPGSPAAVTAGEQAIVSAHKISTRAHVNIGAATSWLDHRFIFDGSPLSEVVTEFNRYNSRRIIIRDAALDSLRISGVYSSTDSDSFLRFLRAQPGIEVTQVKGAINIDRK